GPPSSVCLAKDRSAAVALDDAEQRELGNQVGLLGLGDRIDGELEVIRRPPELQALPFGGVGDAQLASRLGERAHPCGVHERPAETPGRAGRLRKRCSCRAHSRSTEAARDLRRRGRRRSDASASRAGTGDARASGRPQLFLARRPARTRRRRRGPRLRPPNVRAPILLDAIESGRHILSEKPLSTLPHDAETGGEAARVGGITLGVVDNYLYDPVIVRTDDLLRAGEIGSPEVAILNYLGVLDNPGSTDYQPGWRRKTSVAAGGVLMDMPHVVYVA